MPASDRAGRRSVMSRRIRLAHLPSQSTAVRDATPPQKEVRFLYVYPTNHDGAG